MGRGHQYHLAAATACPILDPYVNQSKGRDLKKECKISLLNFSLGAKSFCKLFILLSKKVVHSRSFCKL